MHGDFAHAVLHERAVEIDDAPFVVTNKRRSFVQTRRRPDGTIWAGFSEMPIGAESGLLQELHSALWQLSVRNGWRNRCSSLEDAAPLMQTLGFEPRCLVVPVGLLKEVCGEELSVQDAEKLMLMQGHITKVGEVFVLAADMAKGSALLTAVPKEVGTYTRTDESLAIMLFRVDRALILVGEGPAQHGVA